MAIVRPREPLDLDGAIRVLARVLAPELAPLIVEALRGETKSDGWIPIKSCGLPVRTVRAATKRGELAVQRFGRADFVRRTDLDAWIAKRGEKSAAPPEPANDSTAVEDPIARALANGTLRRSGGGR